MAKFDVVNSEGSKVSELELSDSVFGVEVNENLIYEVAKFQQINRRSGTVAVKNTSLVSGGGKKPWKQKGTGRARQGSIRASHWVGGGKAMGPKPRDYEYRPPRAVRRGGIKVALSLRASEKKIVIVDAFAPAQGKSKAAVGFFKKLGLKNALIIDEKANETLTARCATWPRASTSSPRAASTSTSILRHEHLVLTVGAAKAIEGALTHERLSDHQGSDHHREVRQGARVASTTTRSWSWIARPTRTRSRAPSSACSRSRSSPTSTPRASTAARCKRVGTTFGQAVELEARRGDPEGRRRDRPLRRASRNPHGTLIKYKPTSAGRRLMTVSDFAEITKGKKPERSLTESRPRRAAGATSTATSPRRHQGGGHKQQVPHHRLQARQGRGPRQGRHGRVRPEPLGAPRAAPLFGRHQGLYPLAGRRERRRHPDVG